ncbi:MAG TPA: HAD-IIA family hydrolase [Mycobacteriales bacterium]|nr:HAD-IIA family hydrolase [Mycobacteriales bacterium]
MSRGPALAGTWLRSCQGPLATTYDAALLDLDGVVYTGPEAVEGAPAALHAARGLGMRLVFVTNNASRTPEAVAEQLCDIGVPADVAEIATAAQAVARVLGERLPRGATVLVVGGPGLLSAVEGAGFTSVRSADDRPAAVVQGYAATTTYAELAEATLAVRAGALWVVANRDATLPTPRGQVPGNGALVTLVGEATGRQPIVAGKPEQALHSEALLRVAAEHPLVVGDRLDTDIAGASAIGCDSLLVLTGVTSLDDLKAAPPSHRPTYVAPGLAGLLTPHPEVVADGTGIRCLRATGDVDDGLDEARVGLATSWARSDLDRERVTAERGASADR